MGHLWNYSCFKSKFLVFLGLCIKALHSWYLEKKFGALTDLDSNNDSNHSSPSIRTKTKELIEHLGMLSISEDTHSQRVHFLWLQKQLDDSLYDQNEELYRKWRKSFNKYLKLKTKDWIMKSEANYVCRICEKKFKEGVFKEHSKECLELSEWKKQLKKKTEEIDKACDTAFERKQELRVTETIAR